jgi:protein-disulfide isomerase
VALIGGLPITAQDLETKTAAKLGEEKEKYEQGIHALKLNFERDRQDYLERSLGALVDERALALEAAAKKSTPESLLKALVVPEITAAQVQEFFDSHKSQIDKPFDVVAPQIRSYLAKDAADEARRQYLDALRTRYQAVTLLEPRREAVAASGPVRGAAGAPVTIVEFSDFQCPFCSRLEPVLRAVLKKYDSKVRLAYRHFPLSDLHPNAEKAAEAAVCAEQQGKFWEMHDLLFAEQAKLGTDDLKVKAKRIGLDGRAFDACLDSGRGSELVRTDRKAGEALALMGTPASFINGRFVSGVPTVEQVSLIIDDELRRVARTARR